MKLIECDKPEGVAVGGLHQCEPCGKTGWSYYLIPAGKGFYWCPHCMKWFRETPEDVEE